MKMAFPSRAQVEFTRSCYPPDTRIMLNNMNDPYAPVLAGTKGTVRYVDDVGQVLRSVRCRFCIGGHFWPTSMP